MKRRMLFGVMAPVLSILAMACGPAAPPTPPPAPASAPPPAKPAAPPPAPKPPPEPAKPVSKAPTLPDFEQTARKSLPAGFEEVHKNIEGKYFEQALTALEPKEQEGKQGKLSPEQKMLVYAVQGFSYAMQNDTAKAKGSYRRLLPMWGNWRKEVKAIKALAGDDAKAEPRIALAVDTVGEALFFLAEDKHRPKIDQIEFPTYAGEADPRMVHKHLDGKVKRFVDGRSLRIKQAKKEYDKMAKLEPVKPGRWLVASASRMGAFHAQILEALRAMTPPAEWQDKGPSTFTDPTKGKEPLGWETIQTDYKTKVDELMAPVKKNATEAYEECVAFAKEHKVPATDPFAKSCSDWLAANR
ncbi:MAG: hypothetical protein RIF41_06230 [Polyangiaceae bacterium]